VPCQARHGNWNSKSNSYFAPRRDSNYADPMKLRGGTWFEPLLSMAVLRDSLLLLLPPCFYIAKCNKRECCCIWLSGPGFQDLDKRTLGFSTSTDARTQQAKNPKKQIQKKYVRTDGRTDGRTDRRTDGQTNGHREGLQNRPRRLPVQNVVSDRQTHVEICFRHTTSIRSNSKGIQVLLL